MATQYDLTPVIAKHLDRHLVFPLLEFLGGRGLYDAADIEAAKLALIEKTNMVDYAVDIYQQLNQTDEVGAAVAARACADRPGRHRWGTGMCPCSWCPALQLLEGSRLPGCRSFAEARKPWHAAAPAWHRRPPPPPRQLAPPAFVRPRRCCCRAKYHKPTRWRPARRFRCPRRWWRGAATSCPG